MAPAAAIGIAILSPKLECDDDEGMFAVLLVVVSRPGQSVTLGPVVDSI